MPYCKKCDATGTINLRKIDSYCESCFLIGTNHKFRACIGKNKTLASNENVLICLSRGSGSTVLLDLVSNGLALDNHKKLRITPYFLHLKGHENEEEDLQIANSVIDICQSYDFNVYVSDISDYVYSDCTIPHLNTLPTSGKDAKIKFQQLLNTMPPSAQNDFLMQVKRKMFIKFAQKLDCKLIFTAETATTLALNLLSNIATGRGSQIQNNVGFSDSRHDTVRILRPMKDISEEELTNYIHVKGLKVLHEKETESNSLQSVVKAFVTDLQENFPGTISTMCKTADKIGIIEQNETKQCAICESHLNKESLRLTALEATSYSRMISLMQPQNRNSGSNLNKNLVFPYIHKTLCYGCSRNFSEMSNCKLPSYILQNLEE